MSDPEALFLVLIAIYVSDCLLWVRRDAVAFAAPWSRRFRILRPSATLGNAAAGAILVNPLPPLGRVFVCPELPPDAPGEQAFDVVAVQARVADHARLCGPLQATCNLLFVYLLIAAPAAAWLRGLATSFGGILAGLGVLLLMTAGQYWHVHRQAYPERRSERWSAMALMLLAPPGAIRAHDTVSRGWLSGAHPLTAAQVLLPPDAFAAYARQTLLALSFPGPDGEPVNGSHHLAACERLIRQAGLDPESLLQPPEAEAGSLSYCPRCRAMYAVADGVCQECGGLRLIAFSEVR